MGAVVLDQSTKERLEVRQQRRYVLQSNALCINQMLAGIVGVHKWPQHKWPAICENKKNCHAALPNVAAACFTGP
jgi:hypothetical protein